MTVRSFVAKPREVEAIQWLGTPDSMHEIRDFLRDRQLYQLEVTFHFGITPSLGLRDEPSIQIHSEVYYKGTWILYDPNSKSVRIVSDATLHEEYEDKYALPPYVWARKFKPKGFLMPIQGMNEYFRTREEAMLARQEDLAGEDEIPEPVDPTQLYVLC